MDKIFKDLVVVELASVLAGPAVGMFFAEMGARVIKFENEVTNGDITRKWKLNTEDKSLPYSAYYCAVNYGKEVVMNDLSKPDGKSALIECLKKADLVIANFKLKSAKRMGLTYDDVKLIKEDIIYAQLNGYPNGSDKVAFDVVLQAESGYLSMCGSSKGEPAKMPVALIDVIAAHQLKEGILIALLKKCKTGQGSYVSSSLYESAISSLANQATNWLMNKVVPKKMGTLHPNIAPYGEIVNTKDDKNIVLAIGTDKQFASLCVLIQKVDLIADSRFERNSDRVVNREELLKLLFQEIKNWDSTRFLEACIKEGVPVGLINNLQEVFEDSSAHNMIIIDEDKEGRVRKRVSTIAFSIE